MGSIWTLKFLPDGDNDSRHCLMSFLLGSEAPNYVLSIAHMRLQSFILSNYSVGKMLNNHNCQPRFYWKIPNASTPWGFLVWKDWHSSSYTCSYIQVLENFLEFNNLFTIFYSSGYHYLLKTVFSETWGSSQLFTSNFEVYLKLHSS